MHVVKLTQISIEMFHKPYKVMQIKKKTLPYNGINKYKKGTKFTNTLHYANSK